MNQQQAPADWQGTGDNNTLWERLVVFKADSTSASVKLWNTGANGTIVGARYAPGVPQAAWALGDFDYNGFVDDDDVTLLGVFYDPSAAPIGMAVPAVTQQATAVPEPASGSLVASACVAMVLLPTGE